MTFAIEYARHKAFSVVDRIDHFVKPVSEEALSALYEGDDGDLILESCSIEDIESSLFLGVDVGLDMLLEAVTSTSIRLKNTMKAFSRALNQKIQPVGITAGEAEISKPRRSGLVAVMTARIPLSDGQSVSVVFHAPDDDPLKINPDDKLIAFRFLLNSRDITHVVAPSGGNDLSLDQATIALSNVIERNTEKFKAAQAEKSALKAEIEAADIQAEEIEAEIAKASDDIEATESNIASTNKQIESLQSRIQKQDQLQEKLRQELESLKASQEPEPVTVDTPPSHVLSEEKRKELLEKIWKNTGKDYRSGRGAERSIMLNAANGGGLINLFDLTDEQIAKELGEPLSELSGAVTGAKLDPSIPSGDEVAKAVDSAQANTKRGRVSLAAVLDALPESEFKSAFVEAYSTYNYSLSTGFYPDMREFSEPLQILMDNNVTDKDTLIASFKDFKKFGYLPEDSAAARENYELAQEKRKALVSLIEKARKSSNEDQVKKAVQAIADELPRFVMKDGQSTQPLVDQAYDVLNSSSMTAAKELFDYAGYINQSDVIGYGDGQAVKAAKAGEPKQEPSKVEPEQPEPEDKNSVINIAIEVAKEAQSELAHGLISLAKAKEKLSGLDYIPKQLQSRLRDIESTKRKDKFIAAVDEFLKAASVFDPNAPRVKTSNGGRFDFNKITYDVIDEIGMFGKTLNEVAKTHPEKVIKYIGSISYLTSEDKELIKGAAKEYYMPEQHETTEPVEEKPIGNHDPDGQGEEKPKNDEKHLNSILNKVSGLLKKYNQSYEKVVNAEEDIDDESHRIYDDFGDIKNQRLHSKLTNALKKAKDKHSEYEAKLVELFELFYAAGGTQDAWDDFVYETQGHIDANSFDELMELADIEIEDDDTPEPEPEPEPEQNVDPVVEAVEEIKALVASEGLDSDTYLARMEKAFNVIEAANMLDEYEGLMNDAADKLTAIMEAEEQMEGV